MTENVKSSVHQDNRMRATTGGKDPTKVSIEPASAVALDAAEVKKVR